MKKMFYLFLALLVFVGCEEDGVVADWQTPDAIPLSNLSNSEFDFNEEGGSKTITFYTSESWEMHTSELSDDEWFSISPTSGKSGNNSITIVVNPNQTTESRVADISIVSKSKTVNFRVKQMLTKIRYTSTDGQIIVPYSTTGFGANILSNTYTNGEGVIVFDKGVTSIGDSAFWDCTRLKSIVIPDGVENICWGAFYNCRSLVDITIPDSVTLIEAETFTMCPLLTDIHYMGDVASWCKIQFVEWASNPMANAIFSDEVGNFPESKDAKLYINDSLVTELVIPDSITSIGNYTFSGCNSLIKVVIPNNVTEIGAYAFSGCEKITSVAIPDGVTEIKAGIFDGCSSLTTVNIPIGVTKIGNYAFSGCSSLQNITIPDGVTFIGWGAFQCSGLENITLPDSVEHIENCVFDLCEELTTITIGRGLKKVDGAFRCCYNLNAIYGDCASEDNRCLILDGTLKAFAPAGLMEYTIPNNVIKIGPDVFTNININCFTIPNSVTTIGEAAFIGSYIEHFYCKSSTPPKVEKNAFFFSNKCVMTVYVPIGSLEAYINADYWKNMYNSGYEFVEYDFES